MGRQPGDSGGSAHGGGLPGGLSEATRGEQLGAAQLDAAAQHANAPQRRASPPSRQAVPPRLGIAAIALAVVVALLAFLGGAGVAALTSPALDGQLSPKTFDAARAEPPAPLAAQPFRSCSIDDVASQAGALTFHGLAINARTGEVLFDRSADEPNPTASTLKLVVAAAALTVLGPDTRIPTRVYEGQNPGEVVIVGGGDVSLSSLAPGQPTYYDGATAFVSELAAQAKAAMGGPITSVAYDDSLFSGETWRTSWNVADRVDGYSPPATALMIDGDRATPQSLVSPRSEDPSGRAAASFASSLGLAPTSVTGRVTVPEGARLLGEVWSQPVGELVRYPLLDSDNAMSETLARLVAIELGTGNTFDAIEPAMAQAMSALGLDVTGLRAYDGSGLSADNRVTPAFEVALLQLIDADAHGLGRMRDDLPASNLTGSLDTRFSPNATGVQQGAIHAKTGFINEVYGLAGFIDTADGDRITFAYYVVGSVQPSNRDVLDAIAAASYACGTRLADW